MSRKVINIRTIRLSVLFCALGIFSSTPALAQVFPIQTNITLAPPYSPYLTDYTSPGSQKLMVQLRANDVTISNYQVKLRITIEGVGITLRTKQNFVTTPITIDGGTPLILYGEDIAHYLHPNNLDFQGLSRRQFEQTGKLPEGVYKFSVEVLDFNRGTVVSNRGNTVAWIILNDPPLLNLPRNNTKIRILHPTNIAFDGSVLYTANLGRWHITSIETDAHAEPGAGRLDRGGPAGRQGP